MIAKLQQFARTLEGDQRELVDRFRRAVPATETFRMLVAAKALMQNPPEVAARLLTALATRTARAYRVELNQEEAKTLARLVVAALEK